MGIRSRMESDWRYAKDWRKGSEEQQLREEMNYDMNRTIESILEEIATKLANWDAAPFTKNQWFESRGPWKDKFFHLKIYLRKSYTMWGSKRMSTNLRPCLDIGQVIITPRGHGIFTKILEELEILNPWSVLKIENVIEERFRVFLEKKGYQRWDMKEGGFPSLMKETVGMRVGPKDDHKKPGNEGK